MKKINYYKLSEYIKYNMDINPTINEIIRITVSAKETYPNYMNWFINKHIPGIYSGDRDTIVATYEDEIVGVANIKKGKEKKICTLYFKPNFRGNKFGIELTEKATEALEDDKPLITMPISSIKQFKSIIKKYDWQVTDCVNDLYKENTQEIILNGIIIPEEKELDQEKKLILTYEQTGNKNILKLLRTPIKSLYKYYIKDKKEEKSKKVLSN